jgi:hypothetical protein
MGVLDDDLLPGAGRDRERGWWHQHFREEPLQRLQTVDAVR